jgi:hypothetical protein
MANAAPISSSTPNESTSRYGGDPRSPQYRGAGAYNQARIKGNKKNQLMMMLLQMMMEDQQPEDKATQTYQESLAGDAAPSNLTPALANNPATALMGPQDPQSQPKDDFKNMLLALLLKSQG